MFLPRRCLKELIGQYARLLISPLGLAYRLGQSLVMLETFRGLAQSAGFPLKSVEQGFEGRTLGFCCLAFLRRKAAIAPK